MYTYIYRHTHINPYTYIHIHISIYIYTYSYLSCYIIDEITKMINFQGKDQNNFKYLKMPDRLETADYCYLYYE